MTSNAISYISIMREAFPASTALDNCRSAIGFVYNAIHDKEPENKSYLQNIYFGAKDDKISFFKIYIDDSFFQFNQDNSLADLSIINENSSYDRINDIKKIEKMNETWNSKTFNIKKHYLLGLKRIMPDVFYIRDMPKLKPASIKIESIGWKDELKGYRNSGILFKVLPEHVFDTLVPYNEKHNLGYKINAKCNMYFCT